MRTRTFTTILKSGSVCGGRRARGLFVASAAAALCLGAMSVAGGAAEVDDTRAELEKWVETRRIISKEKRDWVLGREMLNERIELVQREIEALREKIADTEESISEADEKRAELVKENEKLKEASSALGDVLASLEGRTHELLKRLPDPIRDRVKPLSQRVPESTSEESKLSLAERFQNVIGILNEINKFNRDITVASEVRELPDGSSAEVTTLYVGLGQGYYVGANNTIAGRGTTTADGWVWRPINEIAPRVAQAIAIVQNEQVASFVSLPLEIEQP